MSIIETDFSRPLGPSDVIIPVMGVTGSGKSSFISTLLQEESENLRIVGHDLTSRTAEVGFFPLEYKDGRRIFLVDTPGLDDTYRTDAEVLRSITYVLGQTHCCGVGTAGVVYMHRISDNRFSGTAARNVSVLKKLCGERAFPRVVLGTSMWHEAAGDADSFRKAVEHEEQLESTDAFWGALSRGGSLMMRWSGEEHSAFEIIEHIMNLYDRDGAVVLRVQEELVNEGKSLAETEVGMIVDQGLVGAKAQFRHEIQALALQLRQILQEGDQHIAQEMQRQLDVMRGGILAIEASQAKIRTTFETLAEVKAAEYRKILAETQEEQRSIRTIIDRYKADYEKLLREEQSNAEAMREARTYSERQRSSLTVTPRHHNHSRRSLSPHPHAHPHPHPHLHLQAPHDRRRHSYSTDVVRYDESLIDEVDEELERQYREEQEELKRQKLEMQKKMRRDERKKMWKQNMIPLLTILAGIGAAIGGGILLQPEVIVAGVALVATGAQKMDWKKRGKDGVNTRQVLAPGSGGGLLRLQR
ncbi:putative GTP binding domain [Rosellinia necatrix]|uniref:Putative GTP binding domain n=1 Tax=Rosellinia necatrix TaxID=77044 RepID=A0A1S7UMV7_ROSNE|nr:putative GTP binding domain [Rosellinia necatrix]